MKNFTTGKIRAGANAAARMIGLMLALLVASAHAAPGDLDTTFGTAGKTFVDINTGSADLAWAMVHDAAGNIYLGGQSSKTSADFAVARLTASGQLDTSYGTGGKVVVDIGSGSIDMGNALAFDATGNLYIAGTTTASGNAQFAVVRFNHSGQVDTSFGSNGRAIVATSAATNNESGCAVAIDAAGAIYLTGATYIFGTQTLKVARLTPTGQPDTTFGTLGIALVLFNHSTNGLMTIPDASGNLYVQATVSNVVNSTVSEDMALILLDHAGQPITSFGTMGAAYAGFGAFALSANMARDAAGNFYLAGETLGADHIHFDFAVAKLDASGNPIAAFGSSGKKDIPIAGSNGGSSAFNIQLDRDGNLYLIGLAAVSNTSRAAVVAVNGNDGSAMTGFGSNGQTVIDISGGVYGAVGAVRDASGKLDIVANRNDFMSPSDFAAARVVALATNEIFRGGFEAL